MVVVVVVMVVMVVVVVVMMVVVVVVLLLVSVPWALDSPLGFFANFFCIYIVFGSMCW